MALKEEKVDMPIKENVDAYILYVNEDEKKNAVYIADELRRAGYVVETDYNNKSLKAQFKRADYFDSSYLIILNSDDLNEGVVTIKNNKTKEEEKVEMEYLIYYFDEHIDDNFEDNGDDCDCSDCSCHNHEKEV